MTQSVSTEHFHAIKTPLQTGINLIEASAGTGKTFAIAMLALRFVVEANLDVRALLVVTFTKAATEELKTRIRHRLLDAKRAVSSPQHATTDASLSAWLAELSLDASTVRQRLDHALQHIDHIGVFTIHGFCQRILAEHALESGQLFRCELLTDVKAIRQACADDFWRRTFYPRLAWQVALLTAVYPNPDALLDSVILNAAVQTVYPPLSDLDKRFNAIANALNTVKTTLPATLDVLQTAIESGVFKTDFVKQFTQQQAVWRQWLQDAENDLPDFSALSFENLLAQLNGNKFRSSKTKPRSSEEQKLDYLQSLTLDLQGFEQLSEQTQLLTLTLRRQLLDELDHAVARQLREQHALSMDELISGLANALLGDNAALLCASLQQRFAVALIDEFQDTDLQQWRIFSTVFATACHYLYLIGDPKQAIYKFRGADIFSYFAAQQTADRQQTLGQNWRSHPALVEAVNQLFARPQALLFEQLRFKPVSAAQAAAAGQLLEHGQALAPLVLWQLDKNSDGKLEHWTSGKASEAIRAAVIAEIVALLNGDAELDKKGHKTRLQPADIAILIRNNLQAVEYQQSLNAVGIPAVINSKQSVFASQEAKDIYTLLLAISEPNDLALLKQALTVSWFGLDGQALYRLSNDEAAQDNWMARFYDYRQRWQQDGLLAMFNRVLQQERLSLNIASFANAERVLTNIHHLLERLQQAVLDAHLAMHKTLEWLQHALLHPDEHGGEELQLRLESDEQAVKIVTMHSSKGLEYPVVFCPCLWQRSGRLKTEQNQILCHENGQMVVDLGSEDFEQRRERALQEELSEDLRLFYVAVTRAKYRCDVYWADVRTKDRANDSAMAYLLEFGDSDFAAQQQKLKALVAQSPHCFRYQVLSPDDSIPARYLKPKPDAAQPLAFRHRRRSLYSHWQMSSYTALSALSIADAPELPATKAEEPELPMQAADAPLITALPKGAAIGNVLHELLETHSFECLAEMGSSPQWRDRVLLQYGVRLEQPEWVDELLQRVVATPLAADGGLCLKNVKDGDCVKEMPFYLAMKPLNIRDINAILEQEPTYQPLSAKAMSGFLTGFIDLVCHYQGRYYVMDYKSNALADYQPDTLIAAMREHNYGLQYWLYSVVLDRYLRQRLPDYRYETHFGGVKYLFMRGMSPDKAGSGVFASQPDKTKLLDLAAVFF